MPERAAKKKSTGPSQSFFQRMFGSGQMTPEMEQGIAIARKENPRLAPVQPYGLLSRLIQPRAQAYASPGRTLYVNPSQLKGSSAQDVADVLTHEQEHVNQMNARGYSPSMELLHQMFSGGPTLPYGQRPDEMGAFQAEKNRRYAMGRPQMPIPSFINPGTYRIPPSDINLPNRHQPKY